jgi:hypothetical protein
MNLTTQDLNDLIDAVELWERKGEEGKMLGLMLAGLMVKDDAGRERLLADDKAREQKEERSRRQRKDRGILLRAKLIQLRDSNEAEAFLDPQESRPN